MERPHTKSKSKLLIFIYGSNRTVYHNIIQSSENGCRYSSISVLTYVHIYIVHYNGCVFLLQTCSALNVNQPKIGLTDWSSFG